MTTEEFNGTYGLDIDTRSNNSSLGNTNEIISDLLEDVPIDNDDVLDLSVVKEDVLDEISVGLDLSTSKEAIPEDIAVILDLSIRGTNESTTAVGAILEMNDFAEETDVALDMSDKISFGGEDYSAVNSLGGSPTNEGDDFIANANEVLSVNVENSSIFNTAEDD